MWSRIAPRGLRSQILLWSLLPTLLILVAVAYLSTWAYGQVTEALVRDRNSELSRLLAGQMSLELEGYVQRLATLRDQEASGGPAGPSWSQVLAEPQADLRIFDAGVVVVNRMGIVIAADPRVSAVVGEDWSDRSFFRRLMESPAPLLLSNVEPNGPRGEPVVASGIAVLGPGARLEEAILGMFGVSSHGATPFYREMLRLSLREAAQLTLVDANGIALYHTVPQLVGRPVLDDPAVQAALAGEVGARRGLNMHGEEVMASYAPIPGTSCYVVEEESWAELSAVALRYGRWLVLGLALALVVPAVIVWAALSRITLPLRRLTQAAEAMSRGEMHQIVDMPSSQELAELATAFNRMASQLQGLYASLESRVRARTRELSAMNAIANVVSASLDLRAILEAALDKLLELMAMGGGNAYRLAASGDTLILMARRGRATEGLPEERYLPLTAIASRDALAGGAIAAPIERMGESEIWQEARREGWRQVVLVPLVSKDELLGLIMLYSFSARRVAQNELSLLTTIGNQIGVAVENARLYREAGRLAAMAERNRLAQDLHDSVTQTIFAASLLAGVIPLLWEKDPEDARRQLEEVARLTRGALEEMRALLLELRPEAMAQVPLEELLRRLAASTESNARLPVSLEADSGGPLPVPVRVSLYRIAQEAVNNVVKHANASRVWIMLRPLEPGADGEHAPSGVELVVRDDGLGFDRQSVGDGHLGLAIMQERAQDVHARLEIETAPGRGTTVRVTWVAAVATSAMAEGDEGEPGAEEEPGSWRITAEEGAGSLDDRD